LNDILSSKQDFWSSKIDLFTLFFFKISQI
jgi:hypothetical protein